MWTRVRRTKRNSKEMRRNELNCQSQTWKRERERENSESVYCQQVAYVRGINFWNVFWTTIENAEISWDSFSNRLHFYRIYDIKPVCTFSRKYTSSWYSIHLYSDSSVCKSHNQVWLHLMLESLVNNVTVTSAPLENSKLSRKILTFC